MPPSSPRYRYATAADIDAMSRICLAVSENRLSDPGRITGAMYIDYLDRLGRSWVGEVDGAVAGFAAADKVDGALWALFIDPAQEGRGIGKHLLALAADYLFAQGHECLVLSTGAGTRADAFYAAQGWQRGPMKNQVEVIYKLPRPLFQIVGGQV